MSTSRHIIRLAQVSYQIRGEIVSTLAEAGLVRLWGGINDYLLETNFFCYRSTNPAKLSEFPNVYDYDFAFLKGSTQPILGYSNTPFSLLQIKNKPTI